MTEDPAKVDPAELQAGRLHLAQPPETGTQVTYAKAFKTWARVAALSFGGPAGQIAVMHRILVDEKRWVREDQFMHALNFCMLLPGPEAQQLATYLGWLMHGTRGGLTAGILFVLPGFVAILALSGLYVTCQDWMLVQGLFFGLKAAVLAIVVSAVWRIGKRALLSPALVAIALASFIAIHFANLPFPMLVLAAGLLGLAGGVIVPEWFPEAKHGSPKKKAGAKAGDSAHAAEHPAHAKQQAEQPFLQGNSKVASLRGWPLAWRNLRVLALGLTLWWAPVLALDRTLGSDHLLVQQGNFFSRAAVVTFGGAYAVLGYVRQQAVEEHGWLTDAEMQDGLAMAETTPGPLIMVLEFVGFVSAYRDPDPLTAWGAGISAALLTTWVTFVPCFLWIFLGAPHVERLRGNRALRSALTAITAAIVSVILDLALKFAAVNLFGQVGKQTWGWLSVIVPEWKTLNMAALTLAVLAFVLVFGLKRGMVVTLATCCAAGIAWRLMSA